MSINKDTGLWQCFKTSEKGNFIHLVSVIEGITYKAAEIFVARKLLNSPELLFYKETRFEADEVSQHTSANKIKFYVDQFKQVMPPLEYKSIYGEDMPITGKLAYNFAVRRGLNPRDYLFADEGKFAGRIILPYRRFSGEIYYFQGRSVYPNPKIKYLNP